MNNIIEQDLHDFLLDRQLLSIMGRSIVNIWTLWDDSKWIDGWMTSIVMLLNVLHVNCTAHARDLENVFGVIEYIWIFAQQLLIALEVNSVDLQKPSTSVV